MRAALSEFLAATELDDVSSLAASAGSLHDGESDEVAAVLDADSDRQAMANLLMYPELVPGERRSETLIQALRQTDDRYLRLAATVGLQRWGTSDFDSSQRSVVAAALVDCLDPGGWPPLRQRSSAGLVSLLQHDAVRSVLPYLDDDDQVVRHNVFAALVRSVGPRRLAAILAAAARKNLLTEQRWHDLSRSIDHGRATVTVLRDRGVLTTLMAAIPSIVGD